MVEKIGWQLGINIDMALVLPATGTLSFPKVRCFNDLEVKRVTSSLGPPDSVGLVWENLTLKETL